MKGQRSGENASGMEMGLKNHKKCKIFNFLYFICRTKAFIIGAFS
jgi:hypothetical protein